MVGGDGVLIETDSPKKWMTKITKKFHMTVILSKTKNPHQSIGDPSLALRACPELVEGMTIGSTRTALKPPLAVTTTPLLG